MGIQHSTPHKDIPSALVADKWQLYERLGSGGFGEVFAATDRHGSHVAVKIEQTPSKSSILTEADVYKDLQACNPYPEGFVRMVHASFHKERNALVMDLLGPSIQVAMKHHNGYLSCMTTLYIGLQMLGRLETLHGLGYVHCDLKPANIVTGLKNSNNIHLIDFGLACLWRDPSTGAHVLDAAQNCKRGTEEFMSVHVMRGGAPSRRDDLESLAYVLAYIRSGEMRWLSEDMEGTFQKTQHIKSELGAFHGYSAVPGVVGELLVYARKLRFEEKPDYLELKTEFVRAMRYLARD